MKLFNCLLAAIISINVLSVSVFAQTNETETLSPERTMAINVLQELEIVSDSSNEQGLKREEFALMIAKLLNFEDSEELRKVYFTDVPIDNRFSGAIALLVDRGAITVSEDRKFYPKDNVTLAQVYKVLFHLMGYGDYITDVRGGYPSGYLNTAEEFKIDVSVKDANSLSQNEVCEIIYKFGNLGLCTPETYYGNGMVSLDVDSEDTLFSLYHSLYVSRGVITNTYTNALNYADVDENEVTIDSLKYYCTLGNVNEYFADYIEYAYFKEERSPYEGTIISMYAVEGKKYNIDTIFDSECIVGFDSDTYTLEYETENGRTKSEKIKTDIQVVYNGSPATGLIEDYINEFVDGNKKGQVHLKGYNNNDYSYMIIESFDSCVIGQLDATKGTIFDKNDNYNIFTMEEYAGVSLMNHKLEKIAFSELALSNIIEVAESKDKRFLKVIQCSTDPEFVVTGKIKSITDENEIELDNGIVYEVNGYFWDYYEKNLSFSNVYTFYLDYFGDIAHAEITTKDGYKIGYLVKGGYEPFEIAGWLKIYDSTGVMEKLNLAEKPRVDKVGYKTLLHAMAAIPGTTGIVDLQSIENENNKPVFEQQIVRYKINAQGEICEIDTKFVGDSEDDGNTLTMREKITDSRQQYAIGSNNNYRRLGRDVLVDKTKTMVFSVPLVDEQGYCIVWDERLLNSTKSRLTDLDGNYVTPNDSMYKMNPLRYDTRYYQIDCYNYDSGTLYSDILVIHSDTMPDYLEPVMVGKQKTVLNIDNEPIIELECYAGQNKTSLYFSVDFDLTGINKGDIIRAYTDNSTGLIGKIQKVFDRETMSFVNGTGNSEPYLYGDLSDTVDGYSNGWQLSKGYSLRHEGDIIQLSYDYPHNEYDYDEIATINQKVIIYDSDGVEEIHIGTRDEIVDYAYAGDNCSTVIIHSRNTGIYGATFVYK